MQQDDERDEEQAEHQHRGRPTASTARARGVSICTKISCTCGAAIAAPRIAATQLRQNPGEGCISHLQPRRVIRVKLQDARAATTGRPPAASRRAAGRRSLASNGPASRRAAAAAAGPLDNRTFSLRLSACEQVCAEPARTIPALGEWASRVPRGRCGDRAARLRARKARVLGATGCRRCGLTISTCRSSRARSRI